MLIVPLFAALVAVVFAVQLTRQFERRRPHALAWAPTPAIDRQPTREAPMKITVAGTTGRTARHVLAEGLRRGLFERPRALARADAAATLLDIVADPTLARTAVNVAGG